VEQFSDDSEELDSATMTGCEQSYIQSVCTTSTTAAAAAAVCMETSFGVDSDQPRTRVICNKRAEDRLSLQLDPGL